MTALRKAISASVGLKVAVLGVGSLGEEHARISAELAGAGAVDFVGVYDPNVEVVRRVAERYGVPVMGSVEAVLAACDAVSVVTPTSTHYALTRRFLEAGKHVLVEKPMTDDSQGRGIGGSSPATGCVLQVGHVERFNPVVQYLQSVAAEPRFIETHRLSPYPARSTDVGVVLDLMIHDLDVVLACVNAPVVHVDAVGIPVLSASEDIANARLRFANGCVANLTASRISEEKIRKTRIFQPGGTVTIDYLSQKASFSQRMNLPEKKHYPEMLTQKVPVKKVDLLEAEIQSFLQCIRERKGARVSGQDGKQTLKVALQIVQKIEDRLQKKR